MTQVCLEDFDDPEREYGRARKFLFDFESCLCVSSKRICKDVRVHPQGVFSVRKQGLHHRISTQISVFSSGEALRLSINCRLYDISDPVVVAKRRKPFCGAREFVLLSGDKVIVSIRYWDTSAITGDMDIFKYAEQVTRSVEAKREFLFLWNESAAGRLQNL
jgi:hypothetical protein